MTTLLNVSHDPRSGDTPSPVQPPSCAEVSAALRALADAVDVASVSITRPAGDGPSCVSVSLVGLTDGVRYRIWDQLVAGMTGVRVGSWAAGGLTCREASGLLLGGPVRVVDTVACVAVAA